jgi:hypothetical protein
VRVVFDPRRAETLSVEEFDRLASVLGEAKSDRREAR